MARTGRPPQPAHLRVLAGDKRPSRARGPEPAPRALDVEPPPDLPDELRAVWDRTLAELTHMGLVTSADVDALVTYCEAVVMRRAAYKLVPSGAILIRGAKGNLVRNPALQAWRDAAAVQRSMLIEFGLSPKARADLATRGEADGNELDALLSG